MVTDNDPWETAAGLTVTLLLITTVPVRELMMTRAGALGRFDLQIFDHRQERDPLGGVCRRSHAHRAAVDHGRGALAHALVDALHQPRRGGEVGSR